MHRSSSPSRMAQGQITTASTPLSFIAVWPTTAPARLCPAREAEMPGSRARQGRGDAGQALDGLPQVRTLQDALHERTVVLRRGPAQPGQLLEGAGGRGHDARALPADPGGHALELLACPAPQGFERRARGRVLHTEEVAGQPAGTERQRGGELRGLTPPEGHLQRTAAAAAGTPARLA